MTGARRTGASILLLAALCGACASSGASSGGVPLAREDRVLVGEYARLLGVAASQRHVFAAGPAGIAVFDRIFERWLPPVPLDEPSVERLTALAADPAGEGVWIGVTGRVLHYSPTLDRLTSAFVPGAVDGFVFDARDPEGGAYARTGGGWWYVAAGGFARPVSDPGRELPPAEARIAPPSLQELYQRFPMLRGFERLLVRDRSMRSYPVTDGAIAPDRALVWLSTLGGGLIEVDPLFNRGTPRPFGLLSPGAERLARAADGVWAAGSARFGGRSGLTFAGEDLQRWRWEEGGLRAPFDGRVVRALLVRGDAAWAATDRGLLRLPLTAEGEDAELLDTGDGLPADATLSLAARGEEVWVGTRDGIAVLHTREEEGPVVDRVLARGIAVRALAFVGDTLWAGTDVGVMTLRPGDAAPRAVRGDARLARPIVSIAWSDSLVVVATENVVVRYSGGRELPAIAALDARTLGGVRSLAVDGAAIWIVGPRGALEVDRASDVARSIAASELGGALSDVVLTDTHVWLAGDAGLVRLGRVGGRIR
jgi:hypothetical protein